MVHAITQSKLSISVTSISVENDEKWQKLLNRFAYSSYRHNLQYNYAKKTENQKIDTFIFSKGGKDFGGAQYKLTSYQHGIIKIGDLHSGLVLIDQIDGDDIEQIIDHFVKWAKQNGASYIRIFTWLPRIIANEETIFAKTFTKLFNRKGFKKVSSPRHTYWIDLTNSEDEILLKMKKQTRYDIRSGIKSDIAVDIIDKLNHESINIINKFWEFYSKISSKKEFASFSENQFKKEIKILIDTKQARIYLLKYQNDIINISMVSNFGIATYLHGAIKISSKTSKKYPSPGPFAQWKMIVDSKYRGLKLYDMGFSFGGTPFKSHPDYGIWRFKFGFGGAHVEFFPPYGKSLNPVRGKIYEIIRYR